MREKAQKYWYNANESDKSLALLIDIEEFFR